MAGFDFWRTFTGRSGRTEQRGAREQLVDLERRLGQKGAREATGMSRAAAWRLRTGRTKSPRGSTRQGIRTAHRQTMSTPGRRLRVQASARAGRPRGVGPRITGAYTVAGRYQRTSPFRLNNPEALEHIQAAQDAWLAGDDGRAQAELDAAASAEIGQPVTVEGGDISWE